MSQFETNVERAEVYLKRFREGVLNHINGEAVPAADGETFEIISPVDLRPMARVARGKAIDVDRAAKAAKAAFADWAAMPGVARKKLLHKIADGIVARAEEIAFVECMDTGQSLKFMAKAALRGAENFRYFADLAPEARDGQALRAVGQVNVTTRVPLGPIGIITPWNTPFMLSTWKIAPALAAGCTVVHKPAEFSPLTARLLVEIAEEAGLPKGVWNLVNGLGEEAGKAQGCQEASYKGHRQKARKGARAVGRKAPLGWWRSCCEGRGSQGRSAGRSAVDARWRSDLEPWARRRRGIVRFLS